MARPMPCLPPAPVMEETELKKATELDLQASTFTAPKDYQKVGIMEVMNK